MITYTHEQQHDEDQDPVVVEPFLGDYPWYLILSAGLLLVFLGYMLYRSFFASGEHTVLESDTYQQLQRGGHEGYSYVPLPMKKEGSAYKRHRERNLMLAQGGNLESSQAFVQMPYQPVKKIQFMRNRPRPAVSSRRSY
jgi:hypothetical protein